jgi:hypothetical protein
MNRSLIVGDSVDVPDLQTPRSGGHGGVVVQLREDAALVEMFRGGRHWFALDRLSRWVTPDELVAAYKLRAVAPTSSRPPPPASSTPAPSTASPGRPATSWPPSWAPG